MSIVFLLVTVFALGSTVFCLITLIYHTALNGDPADYYPPYRALTSDELAGLKRQFPKEVFRPDIYLIENESLLTQNVSFSGRAVGSYSYNKIGALKVDIFYLGTYDITDALNQSYHGKNRFLIIRGKRKNYVIDINGVNFFTKQKKYLAWFDCWDKAYNAQPTEQKHIRILGQRQATQKEKASLTKSHYDQYPPQSLMIGLLLFLPLLFTLLILNTKGPSLLPSHILIAITVILILAIIYYFFIHSKLYPYDIGAINVIEGKIQYDDSDYHISIGDMSCYISSTLLSHKLRSMIVAGKTIAVELVQQSYVYEVVNIEGVFNINDYWQYRVPQCYYMCYLISAIGCSLFALWLYMTEVQYHPYALIEHTTQLLSFYMLALYALGGISYSLFSMIKTRWHS